MSFPHHDYGVPSWLGTLDNRRQLSQKLLLNLRSRKQESGIRWYSNYQGSTMDCYQLPHTAYRRNDILPHPLRHLQPVLSERKL